MDVDEKDWDPAFQNQGEGQNQNENGNQEGKGQNQNENGNREAEGQNQNENGNREGQGQNENGNREGQGQNQNENRDGNPNQDQGQNLNENQNKNQNEKIPQPQQNKEQQEQQTHAIKRHRDNLKDFELRDHQRSCLWLAQGHHQSGESCVGAVLPCGSGKTLICFDMAVEAMLNEGSRVCAVMLPNLLLLEQTYRTFIKYGGAGNFESVFVCSQIDLGDGNVDSAAKLGECSTKPIVIAERVQKALQNETALCVIFCTYQSSKKLQLAQNPLQLENSNVVAPVPRLEILILDEAHRATEGLTAAGEVPLDQRFERADTLDTTAISAERRMWMTATPTTDMYAKGKWGTVVYRLAWASAIARKLVLPPRVFVLVGTHEKHDPTLFNAAPEAFQVAFGGPRPDPAVDFDEDAQNERIARIAQALRILHHVYRIVSKGEPEGGEPKHCLLNYHSLDRCRAAELMLEVIRTRDPQETEQTLHLAMVSGLNLNRPEYNMAAKKRQETFNKAASAPRSITVACAVVQEGVDLVWCDSIAFGDPKQDGTNIIQLAGRAMRIAPSKESATLMVSSIILLRF